MTREQIEETKIGRLEKLNGKPNLLVVFGGFRQGVGLPVFEFFNSISNLDCDQIFLRDFNQACFLRGVDNELNSLDSVIEYLKNIIEKGNYRKVCFMGNCMGGYGAILMGSILNVDTVLSFAPATFMDFWNRLFHFDFRDKRGLNEVSLSRKNKTLYFNLKKHLSNSSYNTEIHIYYSKYHRIDRVHAEKLKEQKNIKLFPLNEGGHEVVKFLKDKGELMSIIKKAVGV